MGVGVRPEFTHGNRTHRFSRYAAATGSRMPLPTLATRAPRLGRGNADPIPPGGSRGPKEVRQWHEHERARACGAP
jgi:hypothetical protein